MHFHNAALNTLVYGRKRWFMLSKHDAYYSRTPALHWFRGSSGYAYDALKKSGHLFECIQQPGDVIYVPESWAHGVLNVETSVGVAMEYRNEVTIL